MFESVQVGDVLLLSLQLRHTGSNRGTAYVPIVSIENLETDEETLKSLNITAKLLYDTFDFEEQM